MFCPKCGTQIAPGADFCHKCGTRVMKSADFVHAVDRPTGGIEPEHAMPKVDVLSDFRGFIDSHVRTTTGFQSAEELLNSRVPQKFL